MSTTTRRTVVRTGAWSVPGIALAVAAPAMAVHSGNVCELESAFAWKCPGTAKGRPTNYPKTTIVTLKFKQAVNSFVATGATFRDQTVTIVDTVHDCDPAVWHVILDTNGTSQHGNSVVFFKAEGVNGTAIADDNHPYPHTYPCYGNC